LAHIPAHIPSRFRFGRHGILVSAAAVGAIAGDASVNPPERLAGEGLKISFLTGARQTLAGSA